MDSNNQSKSPDGGQARGDLPAAGLLGLLVAQGRISSAQAAELEGHCTRTQLPLQEQLLESGVLDAGELRTVMAQLADQEQWATRPEGAPAGDGARSTPGGRPFGRYVLEDELGKGGMGVVYKAWDAQLCRRVALKTVRADALTEEARLRFAAEARAAAALHHPGIVPVFDVGEHEGTAYLTMGYVEGHALSAEPLPMEPRRAAGLMRDVAAAIGEAHAQGIVHRDLKPGNVLIDQAEGRPLVTDFGLARDLAQGEHTPRITQTGALLGTPAYMSPEQAMGALDAAGPAADVFSMGVMLYELLAGELPFKGRAFRDLILQIVGEEPPSFAKLATARAESGSAPRPSATRTSSGRGRIPADLEIITRKCLEKEAARRYASGAELAADLQRFLDGEPIHARPSGFLYRLMKRARRSRVAVAAIVMAVLAVVMAGVTLQRSLAKRQQVDELLEKAAHPKGKDLTRYNLSLVEQALVLDPDNRRALEARDKLRSTLAAEESRHDKARMSLEQGRLFLARGNDTAAAIAAFDQAIQGAPELAEAWLERGAAHARAQQVDQALADLEHALRLDRRLIKARYLRGRLLMDFSGDVVGAEREFVIMAEVERARGMAVSPFTRLGQAWVKFIKNDIAGAAADVRELREPLQGDADLHVLDGQLLFARSELHDLTGAAAAFDRAIELDPTSWAAYRARAGVYLEGGDHQKALADFEQLVQLTPQRAEGYKWRGETHFALGHLEEAQQDGQRYLEMNPDSAGGFLLLARVHLARGDRDQATAVLHSSSAAQLEPRARWERATLYMEMDRFTEALADLEQVVTEFPRAKLARAHRGSCHQQLGHHEAAIADLTWFLGQVGDGHLDGQLGMRVQLGRSRNAQADAAGGERDPSDLDGWLAAVHATRAAHDLPETLRLHEQWTAAVERVAAGGGVPTAAGDPVLAEAFLHQSFAEAMKEAGEHAAAARGFQRSLAGFAPEGAAPPGGYRRALAAAIAFAGACSASRAGDLDQAFALLARARALEFKGLAIDQDEALDAVRQDPRWPPLRSGW